MKKTLRILCFGDLVGDPGKAMFDKWSSYLKDKHEADTIIVNGENMSKNGRGIHPNDVEFLRERNVSAITSGNHVWAHKKIGQCLQDEDSILLRPANYPSSCPGRGYRIFTIEGIAVAVVSLQGRVFMREDLDCPFKTIDSLLMFLKYRTKIILIDFHAEASSEKKMLGLHLDGQVSCVYGTHTHVQTGDERILPGGTGYITDIGCAGANNSAIGMTKESVMFRFLTQMPSTFKVEKNGEMAMNLLLVEIDVETGKTRHIERIEVIDPEISKTFEEE